MGRVLKLNKNETKFIENVKRDLGNKLKPNTIKTYVSVLINLKRCLKLKHTTTSFLKTKHKEIEECLSKKSLSSQKVAYVALVTTVEKKKSKAFREASDFYTIKYKKINQQLMAKSKENKITAKQKVNQDITFTELRNTVPAQILKDLNDKTNLENYTNYIISLLYFRNEYILRLDYHNTTIIFDKLQLDDNENQLLVEDDKTTMYLNNFKNKKAFELRVGKVRFELNNKLKDEINDFIQWKELS